jgi:hypothetical protein
MQSNGDLSAAKVINKGSANNSSGLVVCSQRLPDWGYYILPVESRPPILGRGFQTVTG